MSNIKKIFFTSDLHLGHQNVLTLGDRPFRNLDHMHRSLIKNYNSVVPEDGVCYFLGDIGLSKGTIIKDTLDQLHGTKICIVGNHDKGVNSLYAAGFDLVLNSASLMIARELVTLSHYPLLDVYRENTDGMKGALPSDNWHKEHKYRKIAVHNYGQFSLGGHIHSPNGGKSKRILRRQMDVGVDANNYRPVSLKQIESFITITKQKEKVLYDIPGFDGYKITIMGKVFSFKRYSQGKELSSHLDKNGYVKYSLQVNGKLKGITAHRLVALTFIDNPSNLKQINHKNGIKNNNTVENLEWISHTDNQRHAWRSGLKKGKLSRQDVINIKLRIKMGESNKDIAEDYPIDVSIISNIRHNKIWKEII